MHDELAGSIRVMLRDALVVHVAVPATSSMIEVATGSRDVFWQHSDVRSGLVAGALLINEAGGTVTDLRGAPWQPGSPNLLASNGIVHSDALRTLGNSARQRV